MKNLLIILSLFILAGCETYSVGGTRISDNVRVSIGVHSGYYSHPYYRYPYYHHPYYHHRPIIVNRYIVQPPVIQPQPKVRPIPQNIPRRNNRQRN